MHTAFDFDRRIERRNTASIKWDYYPADILPAWVADMDFAAPEPVLAALRARIDHGVFGYGLPPAELREVIVARLARLYDWHIAPEMLTFMPGVVPGFNLACKALAQPGEGLLIQTPVYHPILHAAQNHGLERQAVPLVRRSDGSYGIDFDAFEVAITKRSRLFILCNPHNPVGRVFTEKELARMAEICLSHNLYICSDEIHGDLIFSGQRHLPIAALAPEIAARTITLMAPSKSYNIAGLECSFAVIPDPELRQRFRAARAGLVPSANILGYEAALAAYRDGDAWLEALLGYLEANRDYLQAAVDAGALPGVRMATPEGTYLAWLDCRGAGIFDQAGDFFIEHGRVALNDGAMFGEEGRGFVRLNFGCPRSLLEEIIRRMQAALNARHSL